MTRCSAVDDGAETLRELMMVEREDTGEKMSLNAARIFAKHMPKEMTGRIRALLS